MATETTPDKSLLANTVEKGQDHLRPGRANALKPNLGDAKALLTPLIPGAETGIAMREQWVGRAVIPRPEDDFTDPFPSVTDLLAKAVAQNVPGYPAWEAFCSSRAQRA